MSPIQPIPQVGMSQGANPLQPPGGQDAAGSSFGDMLKEMVVNRPSESKNQADSLAAHMAAGADIDPQQLAIATAKAGVEIQMATRTISSAVSSVRTLMQMQI